MWFRLWRDLPAVPGHLVPPAPRDQRVSSLVLCNADWTIDERPPRLTNSTNEVSPLGDGPRPRPTSSSKCTRWWLSTGRSWMRMRLKMWTTRMSDGKVERYLRRHRTYGELRQCHRVEYAIDEDGTTPGWGGVFGCRKRGRNGNEWSVYLSAGVWKSSWTWDASLMPLLRQVEKTNCTIQNPWNLIPRRSNPNPRFPDRPA